jgi:hypothetical protein
MKELEYKLLFHIQTSETKPQIPSYEKAILSFLKEVKRTSVKIKQVCDIQTKLNYFKDYCFWGLATLIPWIIYYYNWVRESKGWH